MQHGHRLRELMHCSRAKRLALQASGLLAPLGCMSEELKQTARLVPFGSASRGHRPPPDRFSHSESQTGSGSKLPHGKDTRGGAPSPQHHSSTDWLLGTESQLKECGKQGRAPANWKTYSSGPSITAKLAAHVVPLSIMVLPQVVEMEAPFTCH